MKLLCTLTLKTPTQTEPLVEDVNIIDLPDGMSDESITQSFNQLRHNVKQKYIKEILQYFDVELKKID